MQYYIVYHSCNPENKWITNDPESWLKENNIERRLDLDEPIDEEDEFVIEEIDTYTYSKKEKKKINKKYEEVIKAFGDGNEEEDEEEDEEEKKDKNVFIKYKGVTYSKY